MTRIVNQVRNLVPGALDPTILDELFFTCKDFFDETNIWYEDVTFTANLTTNSYWLAPSDYTYYIIPTSGVITRLLAVFDSNGYAVGGTMQELGTLILANSPSQTQTYTARVGLTVSTTLTSDGYPDVPDETVGKWMVGLTRGVAGNLQQQPAKPYTNQRASEANLSVYLSARSKARSAAMRLNTFRSQNWQFPQSFAVNRPRGI
jgi:hypothetical protein